MLMIYLHWHLCIICNYTEGKVKFLLIRGLTYKTTATWTSLIYSRCNKYTLCLAVTCAMIFGNKIHKCFLRWQQWVVHRVWSGYWVWHCRNPPPKHKIIILNPVNLDCKLESYQRRVDCHMASSILVPPIQWMWWFCHFTPYILRINV